jgi:MFS family permease
MHLPHHEQHHLHRLSEVKRLYWSHTIAAFGSYLAIIFIPIYLLRIDFSLLQVFIFFALSGLFWSLCSPLAGRLIGRIGANRVLAIANLINVSFFILLVLLKDHSWLFYITAAVNGLESAFYMTAFRINFSKAKSPQKAGRQVGLMNALIMFSHGAAPVIGGLIAQGYGMSVVYAITIILGLVAIVPLLSGPEIVTRRPLDFSLLDLKKIRRDLLAAFGFTVNAAVDAVIWPLFISLIIVGYAGIGLVSSLIVFVSIAVSLYVGRREDKNGERPYITRGSTLMFTGSSLRLAASTASHVAGINTLTGIGSAYVYTPYFSRYYKHADEEPRLEYLTAIQAANGMGYFILFTLLALISLIASDKLTLLAGFLLSLPGIYAMGKVR